MNQLELLKALAIEADKGDLVALVQLCDLLEEIGDPRSNRGRESTLMPQKTSEEPAHSKQQLD